MTIKNIKDFCEYVGVEDNELEKAIYNGTACGAYIHWNSEWIEIGSIVEGSDAEFNEWLCFPFDTEKYEDWINELEHLTSEVWKLANEPTEAWWEG